MNTLILILVEVVDLSNFYIPNYFLKYTRHYFLLQFQFLKYDKKIKNFQLFRSYYILNPYKIHCTYYILMYLDMDFTQPMRLLPSHIYSTTSAHLKVGCVCGFYFVVIVVR